MPPGAGRLLLVVAMIDLAILAVLLLPFRFHADAGPWLAWTYDGEWRVNT